MNLTDLYLKNQSIIIDGLSDDILISYSNCMDYVGNLPKELYALKVLLIVMSIYLIIQELKKLNIIK
jgi:hypothetical protein